MLPSVKAESLPLFVLQATLLLAVVSLALRAVFAEAGRLPSRQGLQPLAEAAELRTSSQRLGVGSGQPPEMPATSRNANRTKRFC